MKNINNYIIERLKLSNKVKPNKYNLNTLDLPEKTVTLYNEWCEDIINKIKDKYDNSDINKVNDELNKYEMNMDVMCNILDHNEGPQKCPAIQKLLDDAWSIIMRDDDYKTHNSQLYNYFIFNLPFFI